MHFLLSNLVMPFQVFIILVCIFFTIKKESHKIFYFIIVLFIVACTPLFTNFFLKPLESTAYFLSQKNQNTHHSKAIVVLGGGSYDHGLWSQPSLGPDASLRMQKALNIYKKSPTETLFIFSGGGPIAGTHLTEGDATEMYLQQNVGFNHDKFLIEKTSKTTYENATHTKKMLVEHNLWHKNFPITLVTSALHLFRSTQVYEAQGFSVLGVPSHYRGSTQNLWFEPSSYMPNAKSLALLTETWHEYIGLLFYWLRGHLTAQQTSTQL